MIYASKRRVTAVEENNMEHWVSDQLSEGIHAFTGGAGSRVVMVPGWPETAQAYAEVFPLLMKSHSLICVDPPGMGDSAPSNAGYDTGAISRSLDQAVEAQTRDGFHLVGHDIGAWIAYAWAAQFPERIKSVTLLDAAVPGLNPLREFPLPFDVNVKLWQFSFNTLPDLPELLTAGHERVLLDWLFDKKAEHPERITAAKRQHYLDRYARPGGMSQAFAYYRAASLSATQNRAFAKQKLPMPVLALGGSSGTGDSLKNLMEPFAEHVEGGAIEDCGHYVMEEQPEEVARRLLNFFARVEGKQ
jgi:pimeloyl-ACP methyl ester carboxylesterase